MFPKDDIFWRLVNEARRLRKAQLRHRLGNWTTIFLYLTGYKWALLDERSLQRRSA
jgi:hypothetical protein